MRVVVVCVWLLAAVACTGPKVQTTSDPSADFTAFHTFAFTGMTDTDQGGLLNNSILRKKIERVVAEQMTAKGLHQVGLDARPDLLVHLWVGVKEKQQVESTGPYGPRYGWRAGYYGGGVTTYDYEEGTLVVDLAESSKNELVWRARIVSTLESESEENTQLVKDGVAEAFTDYPPTKKR